VFAVVAALGVVLTPVRRLAFVPVGLLLLRHRPFDPL
jgi:hypothetical protein